MARNRHLRDGNNAQVIPDGVALQLGSYGTLPTCNAGRTNQIAISGGVIYLCDGTSWAAVGTSAAGVLVVKEGGVSVDGNVTTLDFDASDFTISESPEDEINISLNYGTSAGQPAEGNHLHTGVYQPLDADLTTIAGLTATTNNFMVANGSAWASRTPTQAIAHLGLDADIATLALPASTTISAFGATLVDDADAPTALGTLGLTATAAELNTLDGITSSTAELNILDGVTATAAELNALDGITATVTELNYTDGVTSAIQTQLNAKAATASPSFTGTVTLPTGLTGVLRADTGVVSTDSDVTDIVSAASTTAAGKVELATTAETTTGTDTTRAVTPDGLHDMTSLAGAAWFLDEDAMTSNSDTKTVSQQSVKAYADTKAALSHNHAASDITSGTMATARLGSGTADATVFLRGDQTWAAGPAGPRGYTPPVLMTYTFDDSTTDSDPGSGFFRANHILIASATQLYLDITDASFNVAETLATLDDSTSTVKGQMRLANTTDDSEWWLFNVTGTTDASGYYKIDVVFVDNPSGGAAAGTDGDLYAITFTRTGDKGDTGATGATGDTGPQGDTGPAGPGSGDVTGQASSVDGEITLFSGTSGKIIKRATGTGLVTATSGVYGTLSAPAGSLVGTTETQALTNKDLSGSGNTFPAALEDLNDQWIPADSDSGSILQFRETATVGTNFIAITAPDIIASDGSIALPNASGVITTFVATTLSQTLTNKDLTSGTNTFPSSLATLTGSQTLTNKTLTTPTIASLTNAQHSHQNAAGGGVLAAPGITSFTNATHDHTNAAGGGVLGPAALGVIGIYQDSDYTGSNANTAQKVFNESTNGAANVAASTAYLMQASIYLRTTGTTSHGLSLLFGGTATLTSMGYTGTIGRSATADATAVGGWFTGTDATETVVSGAVATATHYFIRFSGIVRVNGAGTFIPQFKFSAAPGVAPVTGHDSYLTLTPIGANTVTTVGSWS